MRTKVILATILALALTAPAMAQNGVLAIGDEGIVTALEYDGDVLLRGGAISRIGGHDYDWMASVGKRWHGDSRWTVDTALDMEAMPSAGYRDHMYPDGAVDFRARLGVGWWVTERAAVQADYSRSFNNETREGRWMVGARFGF